MRTTYQEWEDDVMNGLQQLKTELDGNEKAKSLYNGFYIWDGVVPAPTAPSPTVLFLGINPGDGNLSNDRSIKLKTYASQITYIEYLNKENKTYKLAQKTWAAFREAGYSEPEFRDLLLHKALKTNFQYIITREAKDIKRCMNLLGPKRFNEFWSQSCHWTGDLIHILKPKVVICEGKVVFDTLLDINRPFLTSPTPKWQNNCDYFKAGPDYPVVVGYQRRYAKREALGQLIKDFVPRG